MKLNLIKLLLIVLCFIPFINAQENRHVWKPLIINEKQKIWYDAAQLDSIKGNEFNIWILQMYTPPLVFSEIPHKVYRSQTLYAMNLNTVKYGIMEAKYFDVANDLLYKFNYHIENLSDNLKYTYPILDNPFLKDLLKKMVKIEKERRLRNAR
mgnify:CR=1 FL=1